MPEVDFEHSIILKTRHASSRARADVPFKMHMTETMSGAILYNYTASSLQHQILKASGFPVVACFGSRITA
eukprot:1708516-Amphidinium_carterae.1